MARAFPASTFVGYDIGDYFLERAQAEAAEYGLRNVRFEQLDAALLPTDPRGTWCSPPTSSTTSSTRPACCGG